jgi:hypothetical protein
MPKLKDGNVGRYVVLPKQLDKWLQKQARDRGLNSPQKFLVMLASDAKQAENSQHTPQPAEAAV